MVAYRQTSPLYTAQERGDPIRVMPRRYFSTRAGKSTSMSMVPKVFSRRLSISRISRSKISWGCSPSWVSQTRFPRRPEAYSTSSGVSRSELTEEPKNWLYVRPPEVFS